MAVGANSLYGYNSTLGVSEETTFGTKVDSFSYIEFVSEAFKRERDENKIESINGGRDFIKRLMGNETITGSLETNLNPASDALVYIMKQAMGGTVSTALITTTVSDQYLHTLNVGDMESNQSSAGSADTKSLSFQIDKGGRVFDIVGARINQLTIKAEIGSPVMISAEIMAKAFSTTSSTPTAVFSDVLPCNFTGITFEVGDSLGNLSEEKIQSFEFSLNNNIAEGRELGDKNVTLLDPLRREVMLKIGQRFDTTTAYSRFINESISAIRITCDSEQTITSGSSGAQTHQLVIDLPRGYYNSNMTEVGGMDVLSHEIDISAISQNTTTAFPVQIKVQNGTANY